MIAWSRPYRRLPKASIKVSVAKQLGIGASTLSRWVKAEKVPKPKKSISGMMLFDKAEVLRMCPLLLSLKTPPPAQRPAL